MNKEKRKENDNGGLDNDTKIERNVRCKVKQEHHNASLSEPTPSGIKRYIYHEHIQRTIDAPKESCIYSEQELQAFLTEAVAIYQMLYFIRNKNKRFCFMSNFLDRLWHLEEFGHENHWTASDCFFVFYSHPRFDEDAFEAALTALLDKTKHEKINRGNKYLRLKVLVDIFNKINVSHVERDI